MKAILTSTLCLMVCAAFTACSDTGSKGLYIPFYQSEAFSSDAYYARVVVPAGFTPVDENTGRELNFVPYPGNYALQVVNVNGDSQVTDEQCLVLGKPLATGSTLEVHPVGFLEMMSDQGNSRVFIATPVDTSLQTIPLTRFSQLLTDYEPVRNLLQIWILNHKGAGSFQLVRWGDEVEARKLLTVK